MTKTIRIILVVLIGGVLLIAAIGKLLDNRHFAEVLAQWQLFPSWSLLSLGVVASLSELLLAVWLFSGWHLRQGAIVAVVFHLGYVVATVLTLLRGVRLPDCGCFGIFFPHPLDWIMAFEDAAFAALSFLLYVIAPRQ
jgi:methylamine utilization protein MauE